MTRSTRPPRRWPERRAAEAARTAGWSIIGGWRGRAAGDDGGAGNPERCRNRQIGIEVSVTVIQIEGVLLPPLWGKVGMGGRADLAN